MNRIIISGAGSHCGKTTIACGLLAAFRKRGLKVCAYKTGPDYIDPQYLRLSGKCEAYNLDTWLMSKELTRKLFADTSRNHDIAIIEGAMGLYDGNENSTASIAKLLNAPVILVINAKSVGESAAAIALGFREYDRNINIAGVVLNNAGSEYHVKIISEALREKGIKCFGALRRNEDITVPERHLGLIQACEYSGHIFERLGEEIEACIDIDEILRISKDTPEINITCSEKKFYCAKNLRIAVARDKAFSFYYPESLQILKELGAEIIYFSPISDKNIPETDGYIFGGGFPEVFAGELSYNISMLESVRKCTKPVFAECGGMMYLCSSLQDIEGQEYRMTGKIALKSFMKAKPVIGYMTARALRDNIICSKDKIIRGHEFHFSDVESKNNNIPYAFELTRRITGASHFSGYAGKNILASYLHINFYGNIGCAEKFLSICK